MDFTFGVLTYQQKYLVIETMESIKYQIETYGSGKEIDLIVVDDASADLTIEAVRCWVQKNRALFRDVTLIDNQSNQGTVHNYHEILRLIKTKYFKVIAGDDLFSSSDLFACFTGLDDQVLRRYTRMELMEQEVFVNEDLLKMYFYQKQISSYSERLSAMRRGGYLHTPSTIYTKQLYDKAECSTLNSKFHLFEDDPSWYSMIKNVPELQVQFVDEVMVLYRIHSRSVSNNGLTNTPFGKEMLQLWKIYYADTKGMEHLVFWGRLHDWLPKYLDPSVYSDYFFRKKVRRYASKRPEYTALENKMKEIAKKENLFYLELQKKAKQFYEDMIDD